MQKLNILLYPNVQECHISKTNSLDAIANNEDFENLKNEFLKKYDFQDLKTFDFSKWGMLGLFLELNSKIAISLGESEAVVLAGKEYEKLGFEVLWLDLKKDGNLDYEKVKHTKVDYIFVSSYIIDTFVKVPLEEIKSLTSAKIVSNASANFSEFSDIIYFDCYKVCGYTSSCIILHSGELEEQNLANINALSVFLNYEALKIQEFNFSNKAIFIEEFQKVFQEDFYFFVDPSLTLGYTLHFGLKNIKARELIRTLALQNIFITNGEGCSLGLSKPSRIIQNMGYEENISRNAISLSFYKAYSRDEICQIVQKIYKAYRQIKVLNA